MGFQDAVYSMIALLGYFSTTYVTNGSGNVMASDLPEHGEVLLVYGRTCSL